MSRFDDALRESYGTPESLWREWYRPERGNLRAGIAQRRRARTPAAPSIDVDAVAGRVRALSGEHDAGILRELVDVLAQIPRGREGA